MLALLVPGVGMGGGPDGFIPPPPTTPTVSQDAGRSRRRRPTIYFVKIDGKTFECRSYEAAVALLRKAQLAAQELADRTIAEAIAKQSKEPVEIPLPTIKMPEISASSRELRKEITATKRVIASVYDKAARDTEIAIFFALAKRREQDEDDELTWLI